MNKYIITMGGQEQGWSRHNEIGIFRSYQSEAERLIASVNDFELIPIIYDNDFINRQTFRQSFAEVLDKLSFGWAYKAICIWNAFKQMNMGDLLLMVDSNHIFLKSPDFIYNYILKNSYFFWNHHIETHRQDVFQNKFWTKRATFVNMHSDEEKFWNSHQIQCNVMGFCKNDMMIRFVREFMSYCLNPKVIFGRGDYQNFEGFRVHRHDQSILTNLICKYNFTVFDRYSNDWIYEILIEGDPIVTEINQTNLLRRSSDLEYAP